jgi:hypothetical protein
MNDRISHRRGFSRQRVFRWIVSGVTLAFAGAWVLSSHAARKQSFSEAYTLTNSPLTNITISATAAGSRLLHGMMTAEVSLAELKEWAKASARPQVDAELPQEARISKWFNFRYSNHRVSIKDVKLEKVAEGTNAFLLKVDADLVADQERQVVRWRWRGPFHSGPVSEWKSEHPRAIISFQVQYVGRLDVTEKQPLPKQVLRIGLIPISFRGTVNLRPDRGHTREGKIARGESFTKEKILGSFDIVDKNRALWDARLCTPVLADVSSEKAVFVANIAAK